MLCCRGYYQVLLLLLLQSSSLCRLYGLHRQNIFLCSPLWKIPLSGSVIDVSISLVFPLPLFPPKGFWFSSSLISLISFSNSLVYLLAVISTVFFTVFFILALALICVPSIKIAFVSMKPAVAASCNIQLNTYSTTSVVNLYLKLKLTVEKCGTCLLRL